MLREPAGLLHNGLALAYVAGGYVLGLAGLFSDSLPVALGSCLLLAHSMVIAAYLVHECAHNLVFHRARHNARLGRVLSFVCGAAYGTYEDIRYKHFRHHVDNDDVVWFEYDAWFDRHPRVLRAVQWLEWLYVPAHDLLMHGIMMFGSFIIPERRGQRRLNVAMLIIRAAAFVGIAIISLRAALLYVVAVVLMVHVLRFVDMLQHDYPYNPTLYSRERSPHRGDKAWEQAHTFSNPLSLRFLPCNWLILNFGFHNAHHADPGVPWYRLPAAHAALTDNDPDRVIPLAAQFSVYHRNRVSRVRGEQGADYPQGADYLRVARSGRGPVGGNAASFLTSF